MSAPLTDTVFQSFNVPFRFPVSFTTGLFNANNPTFNDTLQSRDRHKVHRFICIVDDGVVAACPTLLDDIQHYAEAHSSHIQLARTPVVVPGGESVKNDDELREHLHQIVVDTRLDRHAYIVAIGGGALLDTVGFVAATAHRGIRHIRIPTTVLAQNDSGVGVKNGVNRYGQKNYLGTFAPPYAVLNDYNFIKALPDRDKISGMAEAVKVALIRDRCFFDWLEKHHSKLSHFDEDAMQYMIRRCAELHMDQISNGGDPFETGNTRPLDFGHWAAHRLETLTRYNVRHGEAVAIGIALDARYSVLANHLDSGADDRICRLLERLGFNLWDDALLQKSDTGGWSLLQGLKDFKEHLGGDLCITLLQDIGTSVEVDRMDESRILNAIDWLQYRTLSFAA